MPEKTYNATLEEKLATCEKVYNKSKFAADGKKANENLLRYPSLLQTVAPTNHTLPTGYLPAIAGLKLL